MKNTWNESVKRGKTLVAEIGMNKWELGDLAIKECPAGETQAHDGGRLEKFADEIGISAGALRNYRIVAAAWPHAIRIASQTWTTHQILAAREDREEIMAERIWTRNALRERLGQHPYPARVNYETGEIEEGDREIPQVNFADSLKDASPEVKRKVFTTLAEDNEVVDDNLTRGSASKSIDEAESRSPVHAKAAHAKEASEAKDKDVSFFVYAEAETAMAGARKKLQEARKAVEFGTLKPEAREALVELADELTQIVASLRTEIELTGTQNMDAELQKLTEGK